MKCQKCGAILVAGHLYCDACGADYQIVPDFEPELEISIAKTLSGLGESIQENPPPKTAAAASREQNASPPKRGRGKGTAVFLTFLLILLTACVVSYRNSSGYLERQAGRMEEQANYLEAAYLYERLAKKEPTKEKWYLKEGDMYLKAGQKEEAVRLGLKALDQAPQKEEAYRFLLSVYLQDEEYETINELLLESENERIQEEYSLYMAPQPSANYSEGFYDTTLELLLKAPKEGIIYYTFDSSLPDKGYQLYQEPILLGNGRHSLTAIYVNAYGVASRPLQLEFEIAAAVPLAPVIQPESGTYIEAGFIIPEVEEGTTLYYTTDGSTPTKESFLYEAPIPMPLGDSRFTFVAYSEAGVSGKVTVRNYLLNIKTGVTKEEAGDFLVQEMIKKGFILDKNGALLNRYGVHRYFYSYPIRVEDKHYYVFEERYLENEINQRTGNLYAVDVIQGECFRLAKGDNLEYSLMEI